MEKSTHPCGVMLTWLNCTRHRSECQRKDSKSRLHVTLSFCTLTNSYFYLAFHLRLQQLGNPFHLARAYRDVSLCNEATQTNPPRKRPVNARVTHAKELPCNKCLKEQRRSR